MNKVELIYDADCPNVAIARKRLIGAFAQVGAMPRWTEWDRADSESPDYARGYGSPTILVDGKDVAGESASEGILCCRLYADSSGVVEGAPPVQLIESALRKNAGGAYGGAALATGGGWRTSLAAVPGILFAFLPKIACPACWPAYAGLLSSLGLGFLLDAVYLFPFMLLFLSIAVGALAFRARSRRGYGPFAGGLLASAIVLVGKFVFESDPAMFGGISILIAASIWNGWPRREKSVGACPACTPTQPSTDGNTNR